MPQSTHSDFIFSPISNILREAASASTGIGAGIETFPLCDYVMQSIFIKMTGFQEQKMKCICWDVASVDFEYRYQFTKNPLGECSSYADKNAIYKDLIKIVKKNGISVNEVFLDRESLIEAAANEIFETFEKPISQFGRSRHSLISQKSEAQSRRTISRVTATSLVIPT